MKKKLSKAELKDRALRREVRALCTDIALLRNEVVDMTGKTEDAYDLLIDIAYLLAPVIYDVRTKGKYPLKSMRRVADLIRNNKRGDMTELERAFWTGEKEEVD